MSWSIPDCSPSVLYGLGLLTSTLIAMRHAHAIPDHEQPDAQRPLTVAGRELAESTGRLLSELNRTAELIVASSATRTSETAELVAKDWHPAPRIVRTEQLYLASPQMYLPAMLQEVADESRVLVIGHNPGIGVLMRTLSGEQFSVSPGTVAVFSIPSDWADLGEMSRVTATLTHRIVNGRVVE